MRVLVVATWFPDAASPSTAPFNLLHAQAIAARHDVRVLHVRLGGDGPVISEEWKGLSITRIPLSPRHPGGVLTFLRTLRTALRSADILHTMAFTAAAVAAPVHVLSRVPWLHTEHWSGMARPRDVSRTWALLSWLRWLLKLPEVVTAVSAAQAAQLQRFARQRVEVVPNVVASSLPVRADDGGAPGSLRLVAVGGLIDRKRPHLALETLGMLRRRGHNATLTWVGEGPLRSVVEASAAAAGLGEVFTITGKVEPSRVERELHASDVFILPTAHETFCVAAAEAVLAGIPAVVTALPAVRDFLTAENSILVSGERAADFADGVELSLQRFASVSRSEIANTLAGRFSADQAAFRFSELYSGMARGRTRRRGWDNDRNSRPGGENTQREENPR